MSKARAARPRARRWRPRRGTPDSPSDSHRGSRSRRSESSSTRRTVTKPSTRSMTSASVCLPTSSSTTSRRPSGAPRVHGRHGVDILNIHAAGGEEMLRAGVEGLRQGAAEANHPDPIALGVTVLTSDPDTTAFSERLAWASAAGCDGVVCAAAEAASAHALDLRAMVPGIRLPGGDAHDQARVATPANAIRAGADWLVVGRAVTAAPDPEHAAARVAELVDEALESP